MLPLIAAVFTASLLGSMHCAGMCGAFVAFAVGGPDGHAGRMPSRLLLNAAYNLGRLVTYAALGAAAGSLGAALDLGGSMVGVQRAAAITAGALMIGFGAVAVLRHAGVRVPRMPLPTAITNLARKAHARAFDLSPLARAWAVGLLTTLLPCGWLYAFVITSAGTAHPGLGALTMLAFWAGTLPVMASLGVGVSALAGPLRRHVPLATSLLLVVVGVATVLGRIALPAAPERLAVPTNLSESSRTIEQAHSACPLCPPK